MRWTHELSPLDSQLYFLEEAALKPIKPISGEDELQVLSGEVGRVLGRTHRASMFPLKL